MRSAIYGAGAMGTILGAYIAKAGKQIDLINRNKAHIAALKKNGAKVIGKAEFIQPVSALLPEEMTGRYDIIFLMTKQRQNNEIVAFLKDYLAEDGVICTMQNGMPEPAMAEIVGKNRVYGCAMAWGATFLGEGVSELTSEASALTFSLGAYGEDNSKLAAVKELLECMGEVTVEENLIGARWAKLMINAAFSGLSTVTGWTFGEISKNKETRKVAQGILKECMDVAKKANITIEPIQGHDVVKLLDYNNAVKKAISFFIIPIAMKKHALLISSMLQDLRHGKRCEIDYINGVVCDYGKKYSVPTPLNDKVVEIVHGIEDGAYQIDPSNITLF